MNIQRIKSIEKIVKEKFKPLQIEYIRQENNKMIVIEPGLTGIAIKFSYILGATERLSIIDFSIEEINKLYPGYVPIDITEEMNRDAEINFFQ